MGFENGNLISSVIIYDKRDGSSYEVGFGCNYKSSYNLSDQDKKWFDSIIKTNTENGNEDKLNSIYYPPDLENISLVTSNFPEYLVIFVISNNDPKIVEQICKSKVQQVNIILDKLENGTLHIENLKVLNSDKKMMMCKKCQTTQICLPKYYLEIDYM